MSKHFSRSVLESDTAPVRIVSAPSAPLGRTGRTFDLHPRLYAAMFGGMFAYLGIMWAAFGEKPLAISFVVFAVTFAATLVVPGLWARVDKREGPQQGWADFLRDGFECMTGHLSARETIAQVLIMPAMLLLWGLSVAVIRAFY